ncbi:MAG: SPFH domain-containing protein [Clostridia bacterium]|nr:SPFH domain-containing protein [Clostridia bacterium]
MGLIKAIAGAAGGVLADSWREYFYSDALDADVLVVKGQKRTSKRSSNTRGEENIISNGSIVAVADGQCMMIVEQGKIVEVCAEPGEFVYDTSTEPSSFYGKLGESILKTFQTIGKRFTFGGDTAKDQRVYYFNTKEIIGNKYGTPNAVPFRVVDTNVGLDIDIAIKCFGEYSYRVCDPLLFYTNVCGNVADEYRRDNIDSQLKSELMTALQPAFAKISEMGIRYSALPGHTAEIADALNEVLSAKWSEKRGIKIEVFGVSSVKASDEDEAMIKELQRNAAFRNPTMAAAHLVGAQAQAMQDAAKNEGGMGAMGAFMGMNMAGNAAGMNAQNLFAMGQQQQPAAPAAPATAAPAGWTCSCGKTGNTGKFCEECGQPQQTGWTCSCGAVNMGKFCSQCGAKKPADAPLYRCDKCGWQPEDPTKPPKFCPECGDVFDDNDIQ